MISIYKRTGIILLAMLLIVLTVTVYRRRQEVSRQPVVNMDMFWYANFLPFHFRIVLNSGVFNDWGNVLNHITPSSSSFDPSFNEFIFVHNEAESLDLPSNVIAAWPREDSIDGLIAGFHWAVNRTEDDLVDFGVGRFPRRPVVTLEQFGLTYPLTVEDFVVNWEKVNELFQAFDGAEQTFVVRAAVHGGPMLD